MIDSHCHLDFEVFDADRDQVLRACYGKTIDKIVIPGVEPNRFSALRTLCESFSVNAKPGVSARFPELFYAVGLHPWWLSAWFNAQAAIVVDSANSPTAVFELLYRALENEVSAPRCIAIGESGLHLPPSVSDDTKGYKGDRLASSDIQRESLQVHIDIAEKYDLPLILHSVGTNEVLREVLRKRPACRGVIHAFSGSFEQAKAFWEMGFYLGVGGIFTYERARKTREAIRRMPMESLLLETDAPDMPLSGRQGMRNSPTHLVDIAKHLAEIKSTSLDDIVEQTTSNTRLLFTI